MRKIPLPEEVRRLVARTFEEIGGRMAAATGLSETILVDEGRYVARSYRAAGYMAMWLVELGIIQFYGAEGEMLRTVNLFEEFEPQQMAA